MTRVQIQAKITLLESQIAEDKRMMEIEPQEDRWFHDYKFNSSLLYSYQNKLEECKC